VRKFSGHVVFVLLTGALVFGQNGSSFSPVNPLQTQVPAQDNTASPASATNPAASTVPVPPSSRVNGAPAANSEPSSNGNGAPPATSPVNSSPARPSSASAPNATGGSNPAINNGPAASPSSSSSSATYARPLSPINDPELQIPVNTEMRATLDTPLSTRTSKAGDRFSATLVDSVRAGNGSIALPAGTRVEGEITEAEPGKFKPPTSTSPISALKGKGKLSLRFRDAILPNGQTLPLNTSLVSVNSRTGSTVKRIGDVKTSAGVTNGGSTFGAPLKGFAIGALAGGGHILAIRSKDVDLPAQTGMVIRFDQPQQ
jgi:hypothetical protein